MAGVASALIVLVTILKLGPLFQELPKVFVIFLLLFPTKRTTVKWRVCHFLNFPHLHFHRVEVFYIMCVSGCTFFDCLCKSEGNV